MQFIHKSGQESPTAARQLLHAGLLSGITALHYRNSLLICQCLFAVFSKESLNIEDVIQETSAAWLHMVKKNSCEKIRSADHEH